MGKKKKRSLGVSLVLYPSSKLIEGSLLTMTALPIIGPWPDYSARCGLVSTCEARIKPPKILVLKQKKRIYVSSSFRYCILLFLKLCYLIFSHLN